MAFGQHQTFYLRQKWLTKGLVEVSNDSRFFYTEDCFEKLGVGKNMAKAIRHWLVATGLVYESRKGGRIDHVLTEFGEIVLEHDRFIQNPITLGLLHYNLVSKKDLASTWYWFFNVFPERVFSKQSALESLTKWVEQSFEKAVSESSLKRDIDCLIQLYLRKGFTEQMTPEDVIQSPLELLGLVQQSTASTYVKKEMQLENKEAILFLALIQYSKVHDVKEFDINDLVNTPGLLGKTFNIQRVQILEYVELLPKKYPVKFIQTNRLNIVRIDTEATFIELLKKYLKCEERA